MENDFSFLDSQIDVNDANLQFKVEQAVKYICLQKEPSRINLDNRAQNAVYFMRNLVSKNFLWTILVKCQDVVEIFSNLLAHNFNDVKAYLRAYDVLKNEKDVKGEEKEGISQFKMTSAVIAILWCETNSSLELKYMLYKSKGFENLLLYIKDEEFIKSSLKLKYSFKTNNTPPGVYMLRANIGTLNNMSKIADEMKSELHSLKAAEIIMRFGKIVSDLSGHRISAYMAAANILNDNEIDSLEGTKNIVADISKLVNEAANTIATGKNGNRAVVSIDMTNDGERKESVSYINVSTSRYHVVELLEVLYKIAINDNIKTELFDGYKLKDSLRKIILFGNEVEKEFALKLLWQLCFNKEILQKVHKDEELFAFVRTLKENNNGKNERVEKYAHGILWSIEHDEETAIGKQTQQSEQKRHVMISYNSNSRDLCLKIKAEIERMGIDVWIDVEDIHGSSLESMAKAIENSKCVVMVMSEKYKQSPNCRAEAEYTFKLNVPFVPIIDQANYMPDGWLGLILGSKIYVNFTKYSEEECMRRLMDEIMSATKLKDEKPIRVASLKSLLAKPENNSVEGWTKNEVQKWVVMHNVDPQVADMLLDFDGKMLKHLLTIKRNAPEYFYSTISQKGTISLKACVKFSLSLDEIFMK